MSTIAIIAILIGAVIVIALVASAARRSAQQRQLARTQTEAHRDDAGYERDNDHGSDHDCDDCDGGHVASPP